MVLENQSICLEEKRCYATEKETIFVQLLEAPWFSVFSPGHVRVSLITDQSRYFSNLMNMFYECDTLIYGFDCGLRILKDEAPNY